MPKNREIILNSRPQGFPNLSNFTLKETALPTLKGNDILIQGLYLSVDPYMRMRMNESNYFDPFQLNQPLNGGVVGKVVESKDPTFKPGDIVLGFLPWADYSVAKANELKKLDASLAPITTSLGILGMPGMTAYFGLLENGFPQAGETVVISGAAGAVGSAVGQIAKIKGCRVIGIAGSREKTAYLTQELGFDAAINYKDKDYAEQLKKVCSKGVDIYFDNVGGDVTDQVLLLINKHARIVICGQISTYNLDKKDVGPRNFWTLLVHSATAKGFIVDDYEERYPEGVRQMAQWIKEGKLKYREDILRGLENAPKAFLGLFKGENIGKQLVLIE